MICIFFSCYVDWVSRVEWVICVVCCFLGVGDYVDIVVELIDNGVIKSGEYIQQCNGCISVIINEIGIWCNIFVQVRRGCVSCVNDICYVCIVFAGSICINDVFDWSIRQDVRVVIEVEVC